MSAGAAAATFEELLPAEEWQRIERGYRILEVIRRSGWSVCVHRQPAFAGGVMVEATDGLRQFKLSGQHMGEVGPRLLEEVLRCT